MLPGETALAFYTAKNNGNEDLIGIATYNMTPEKVSLEFVGLAGIVQDEKGCTDLRMTQRRILGYKTGKTICNRDGVWI